MYSIIHMALVEMVSRMEDGEALLKQIFENVEAGDPKGNVYRPFTDQESLRLIETAGKVLEMTIDEVISGMGEVQLATFEKFGYLPLIHALGRDFVEFCQHIDSLHQNLVQSYPSMVAPSFRPELTEDGPMFLHYYSIRPGLWPYAYSLLVAVAKHIYSEDINIDHYQKRHEGHDHDIFAITNVGSHKYNYAASASSKDTGSKALVRRAMTPEQVNDVFPWHVEFDRHLKITSLGSSLASRFDELKLTDLKLFDIIKFQRPSLLRQDFDSFLQYDRQSFLVIVRDATYFLKKQEKKAERKEKRRRARAAAKCPMAQAAEASEPSSSSGANIMQEADMRQIGYLSRSSSASSMEAERFISETVDYLYLKGELIFNEDSQTMFMAGAPHVTKPQEMYLRDMSLSDLPVHSNARELLFSSMHQSATINIARQLEDTMEHLDTARDEMNREKARVEELLHGILPPAIANQLAKGIRPEAERHRSVTILFSDIGQQYLHLEFFTDPLPYLPLLDSWIHKAIQLGQTAKRHEHAERALQQVRRAMRQARGVQGGDHWRCLHGCVWSTHAQRAPSGQHGSLCHRHGLYSSHCQVARRWLAITNSRRHAQRLCYGRRGRPQSSTLLLVWRCCQHSVSHGEQLSSWLHSTLGFHDERTARLGWWFYH
eukprot:TRINITY_DN10435_c0_g2_i3.p1 TRINITY_DN10435_c0_g2~~TRINITY_DN10435_c0_g2_i3.p1  ORF type:complete len:658 (+),score=125.51 TRINITY_DN10435_c0_g2_i3:190-2163(+)